MEDPNPAEPHGPLVQPAQVFVASALGTALVGWAFTARSARRAGLTAADQRQPMQVALGTAGAMQVIAMSLIFASFKAGAESVVPLEVVSQLLYTGGALVPALAWHRVTAPVSNRLAPMGWQSVIGTASGASFLLVGLFIVLLASLSR